MTTQQSAQVGPPGAAHLWADPGVRARRWWILAVLCLSLLVVSIDNTILNVALPSLVRELHASSSDLQWFVDGYTLVFASFLLTAGSLAGGATSLSLGSGVRSAAVSAVPEPSTMTLLALAGAVGLGFRIRRRRI